MRLVDIANYTLVALAEFLDHASALTLFQVCKPFYVLCHQNDTAMFQWRCRMEHISSLESLKYNQSFSMLLYRFLYCKSDFSCLNMAPHYRTTIQLNLFGPSGAGKTCLANAFAHDHAKIRGRDQPTVFSGAVCS